MPSDSTDELKRRADEQYDNGNYNDAIQIYSEIIKMNPHDWRIWLIRGLCSSWLGNNESALQDLNKSLALKPDNWIIMSNKCTLLDLMGRTHEADRDFSEFCEKYPIHKQMLVGSPTEAYSTGTWYEPFKVFGRWLPSFRRIAAKKEVAEGTCNFPAEVGYTR